MRFNPKKLFLKNIIPSILFIVFLKIHAYIHTGLFVPIQSATIGLFTIAFIGTFIFWDLLKYFQDVTGIVMKENWIGRIVFIIGILIMVYLYKSTGRI